MANFKIYPDQRLSAMLVSSHPVFQFVEKKFNDWIDYNASDDQKDMYFSEDAIFTKKGAIQQAIEAAHEEATEEKRPVCMESFDYAAIFQG